MDNVFKDAPLHYESVLVATDLMAGRGLFHECEKKNSLKNELISVNDKCYEEKLSRIKNRHWWSEKKFSVAREALCRAIVLQKHECYEE